VTGVSQDVTTTGEIFAKGRRTDDEWETYIRAASPEASIIDRGIRWAEYADDCRTNYGKQGGSHFSEFAETRFGMSQPVASKWVQIGRHATELILIKNNFDPDWNAFYDFTRLADEAKKKLLESGERINQKQLKALQADKHLLNVDWRGHVSEIDDDIESNVVCGAFQDWSTDLTPESVDLVFCDPPYDRDSVGLYADAAAAAMRVLRPGGSFMAYSGHYLLPEILAGCSAVGLRYWWMNAMHHNGGSMARMTEYGIIVHWRPIVWFVKSTRGDKHTFVDDLVSTQREKDTHEWQQPLAEADYYIRQLSSPAGLVVDFFCGSGTTALAADRLGRKWRTYEIDPITRDAAVRRIQADRSSRRSNAA
jgi:hypothetical protein